LIAPAGYWIFFAYFGIYAQKSIRYIATVDVEVVADWDAKHGLVVKDATVLTPQQTVRLAAAIQEATAAGWNIAKGHRFFLFDKLVETDFKKSTPGGIFRVKYFDLAKVLDTVPGTIEEIASELKKNPWPKS